MRIFKQDRIKHILVRHEQAATPRGRGLCPRDRQARRCARHSGPGATNAVTGITDALMDSIPMVVITGQVPTGLIGTDAFQEADTVGITRHCSKHNYLVKDPARRRADDPRGALHRHLRPAGPGGGRHSQGRPGRDGAVRGTAPISAQDLSPADPARCGDDPRKRSTCWPRPSVRSSIPAAGSSTPARGQPRLLRQLADMTGAPVTSTLMGLGAFPASADRWLGMLGMHGTYEANLGDEPGRSDHRPGARFDDRVTGRLDPFAEQCEDPRVDIDRFEYRQERPAAHRSTARIHSAFGDAFDMLKFPPILCLDYSKWAGCIWLARAGRFYDTGILPARVI